MHGRVTSVFHLNPTFLPAAAIWSIAMLRYQALKPELARLPEQVGADLALFERRSEDAIRPASQQPLKVR
jgi:hypothetical protein